jgi:two-component system sensor histidine kinase RegB
MIPSTNNYTLKHNLGLVLSAPRLNLQRLNMIRSIVIIGQLLALCYFWKIEDLGLPVSKLFTSLSIYILILCLSAWRCQWRQPITGLEFSSHLLIDISFFTALLYLSGGASNPFVSYYLVPISIAAATLPKRYTWSITLLSVLAYSCLLKFNHPIPALAPDTGGHAHHQQGGDNGINLHIMGMWANFLISAVLITYFVVQMANELRRQEQRLVDKKEDQLRDEQVLAVATLAAGTAHELGTPLNTMQILLDEMSADKSLNSDIADDLTTLSQQINVCRSTLQQLVATARLNNSQQQQPQSVRDYFQNLFENWSVMRPDAKPTIHIGDNLPDVNIYYTPTISQSLQNLLNNAADASPEKIDIKLRWNSRELHLIIRDYGPGISAELAEQIGEVFVSNKTSGLGIGLFLSQSNLSRFGGKITIQNCEDHCGVITTVILPLKQEPTP